MRTVIAGISLVAAAIGFCGVAQGGAVLYVDGSSASCPGLGTQADPFCTIGAAMEVAQDGDEVIILDGVYTGGGNKDLSFGGKAIRVRSQNGPGACAIDCEGGGQGFVIQSGETSASIVEGLRIENGNGNGSHGGAILVRNGSSPVIRNCVFLGNSSPTDSTGGGGAIMILNGSHPHIDRCTFASNVAPFGGAIDIEHLGSDPTITSCVFLNNTALTTYTTVTGRGGAVQVANQARPVFINCLFIDNSAEAGGSAIQCTPLAQPLLVNCTIVGSAPSAGGGVLALDSDTSLDIHNSIIRSSGSTALLSEGAGSLTVTHSNVEGGWPGTGNIDADPLFIGGGDFHLAGGSPCIDAGDNSMVPAGTLTDLEGNPRIRGDAVDMGAYELVAPCVPLRIEQVGESVVAVVIDVPTGIALEGGELGIAYDSQMVRPLAVRPGPDFPAASDPLISYDLASPVHCDGEPAVSAGLTASWIVSQSGEAELGPGEHRLLEINFWPSPGATGATCFASALRFVECLGPPEAPVRNVCSDASGATLAGCTADGEVCVRAQFVRGDANADGRSNLSDGLRILAHVMQLGPDPECLDAADVNDDGEVDIADAVYHLLWRFGRGSAPPPPLQHCGPDETEDGLSCDSFPPCQ